MKDLSRFTSLYPVSKTLRFELIPVGDTLKHIEERGIIDADIRLAESYKKMKKTIDEFHKDFINSSLRKVRMKDLLEDYYALYTAAPDIRSGSDYKKNYDEVRSKLRKTIAKAFRENDLFKVLDKKELIQQELRKWIDNNDPDLYFDPDFCNFTTYFTGYNENRMNMYSDGDEATAVGHRLIDENLPKFIDNIRIYEQIKSTPVADKFPQLLEDMGPWLNVNSLDELFSLKAYEDLLTQPQIDAYNTLIGGRTEGDIKYQGLNEYINLFNQQNPARKLPKLKMLYKQILSDRESASWLPEAFENSSELLDSVNIFYKSLKDSGYFESLYQSVKAIKEADTFRVYIRGSALNEMSNGLFGDWSIIRNALNMENGPGDEKKEVLFSIAAVQSALDVYVKEADTGLISGLSEYSDDCVSSYFEKKLSRNGLLDNITAAYSAAEELLNTDHGEDYVLSQNDKNAVKLLMDSFIELLHFLKPLYLKTDAEVRRDDLFYSTFTPLYEQLGSVTKLYDKVRNYVTRKPFSTEKIKLNFNCSTLLDGWDVNKETQNLGILLKKEGDYYLGIMNKSDNKVFSKLPEYSGPDAYQKIMYKLLPGPNKMLPKVFFSKSRIEEFAPSEDIIEIYKSGSFKKGADFSVQDCRKLIDFYKASIEKHPDWREFGFNFSPTEEYNDISEFYREISDQGYKITFKAVSEKYIDSLVGEGKLYLFKIYNKDFSPYSKGKPNLHTLYWKALFDERNLENVVYKLNGQAEVFYRKRSIPEDNRTIHHAGQTLAAKNPELQGKTSTFDYDIIKDRRYTVDKFQFHVPVTMNFTAAGTPRFNEAVCNYIKNNPDINIIGIDRGERHLLYISMIDRDGNVVKDPSGRYIQYSLNTLTGEYKNSEGEKVAFSTPYHELLGNREAQRERARENWSVIENIKELKSGYLSQVVHHIAGLMADHNAVLVLEDLNSGFKNSRKKVEKQVYQNFEKAMIEKLNYLVFKDLSPDETGGLYHALQLTDRFSSFRNLTKQSGFIFYVPAWNTSKIDPVTGFVDLLKPKYKNIPEAKEFFRKFESIKYNKEKDYFEFSFDYSRFTDKAEGTRTDWTVCTSGALRYAYEKSLNNGRGGYAKWNVTEKLKELFVRYGIDYKEGDLIGAIAEQNSSGFYAALIKCLQVTLAMRYSSAEDNKDFILSPVADRDGNFYCSEGRSDGLPQDADANGAYNIARKGLYVLNQIDRAENYKDWTTKISNKQWLSFVQSLN